MNNDCIEKIKTRHSIRKFKRDPIPEPIVQDIIEIGTSSPSAGNRQPWRVVVVRKEELKKQLAQAAFNQNFISVAPVIFVVCAVPEESAERYQERGRSLYAIQDTAALTLNLLLGAHLHGYGACWIGAFNEEAVSQVLNIPSFMRPVSMVPVGSIDGSRPPVRPRKSVSDIVVSDKFT